MKSFIVLFGALVILTVATRQADAGYDQINQYLVDKVNSPDVSKNMDAAVEWLKVEEVAKRSVFAKNPVPDLKKFTMLTQVIDDPKCDGSDYEIMKTNEAAVGLHHLYGENKVFRRVDTMMNQIFKDHADKCQHVYPANYRAKKGQFDATAFERVEKLGETVLGHPVHTRRPLKYVFDPENLFYFYITRVAKADNYIGENIYQAAIIKSARDDPNVKYTSKVPDERTGKLIVHKDKLKQLVADYLIKPCQQYVDTFGPDLFIPAWFDAGVFYKRNTDYIDYYLGWTFFKICQAVNENQSTVFNDVYMYASGRDLPMQDCIIGGMI